MLVGTLGTGPVGTPCSFLIQARLTFAPYIEAGTFDKLPADEKAKLEKLKAACPPCDEAAYFKVLWSEEHKITAMREQNPVAFQRLSDLRAQADAACTGLPSLGKQALYGAAALVGIGFIIWLVKR